MKINYVRINTMCTLSFITTQYMNYSRQVRKKLENTEFDSHLEKILVSNRKSYLYHYLHF